MKLTENPAPYGNYYLAFATAILQNPRLLIVGYGAADPHVNAWLGEFVKIHGSDRRVVWVSKVHRADVGKTTPERTEMSALAGPGCFKYYCAYDNGDDFQDHGALRLVPCGFPLKSSAILDKTIDYLS
jgi:hypothetical protein